MTCDLLSPLAQPAWIDLSAMNKPLVDTQSMTAQFQKALSKKINPTRKKDFNQEIKSTPDQSPVVFSR